VEQWTTLHLLANILEQSGKLVCFSHLIITSLVLILIFIHAGCFINLNKNKTDHGISASICSKCFTLPFSNVTESFHIDTAGKPLVISHNGASGDYPDCTDEAYKKAVADGADVIDCSVQVTKDGIPICMGSIDLMDVTTVATSQFATPAVTITDLQDVPGVFTFNLTWDDITKNLQRKSS
jgi:hypothetical protein